MPRAVQLYASAKGWTKWGASPRRGTLIACCDCGLTHDFQFRLHNGRLQFRVKLMPKHTAGVRRALRHAKIVKVIRQRE